MFNAVDMPAVTNFRVSFDFCYGGSFNIGVSSLLVWALGASPSKDTLWSTTNNHTAIPGCSWTPDHEAVASELHVVLALMSNGPVGISDAIGMSNASLLKRIITKDGTLLKPSKPITAIDSMFKSAAKPEGQIYATYSTIGDATVWYFVSFQMQKSYTFDRSDFYPTMKSKSVVYRTFTDKPCIDGADAFKSGCVTMGSTSGPPGFGVRKSNLANTTAGTDLAPDITSVWTPCGGGWVYLGELSKYVSVSPIRFTSITCTTQGILVTAVGVPHENLTLTALRPNAGSYQVSAKEVVVPPAGQVVVRFQ